MLFPDKPLSHFKIYIQDNWALYNDYTASKLKPLLYNLCQPLTAEEDAKFAKWFADQKTIEKRRLRKPQPQFFPSTSSSSAFPGQNISEITSAQTGEALEEKKQDQNLELFLNDESQLVSGLLQLTTSEDKFAFLKSQLQSNFLVLTKFMRTRREAPQGFLPLIFKLCKELQENQLYKQTLLFIRVCALHQKEALEVTKELIQNAFMELANDTVDDQAAYGLLKLAYLNNISFKSFPLDSLNKFQERYQMPLKRLLLFLEESVDYKPLKCLPLTCFIFTHPFYNLLKDSGARLQENVEPDYQVQFVELLAYSFEGLEENVSEFIDIFTEGCIEFSGRNIQLLPLLEKLIIREQKQDKLFFDSLKNQITLFKHLFAQLREHRILRLDDEIIEFLLSMNEEQFYKQSRQPRVIGTAEEKEKRLNAYWEEFAEMNPQQSFDQFSSITECPELANLAKFFGITNLNPAQLLSFLLMKEQFKSQRLFNQFTTGTGKTTLSLIWMLYSWQQFKIPSIANYTSVELCQYDYERLVTEAGSFNLSILLITTEEQLVLWGDYNIIFIITPLLQALAKSKLEELRKRQLILDEFDAALFDGSQIAKDAQLFLQFRHLVAFTGSPLEAIHKNIITKYFEGLFLQYPSLDGLRGRGNVCHKIEVFPARQPQYEKIVEVCLEQSSYTPMLVILDKAGYKNFLTFSAVRNLLVKNLAQAGPKDIKAFFSTSFLVPKNGHFFTALLNVSQGRGLDAPTNSAIDKAGGVYVIVGATPNNFRELEQFKGRTARMGGHGQYAVILWGKTQATPENFLQEHLVAQSFQQLQQLSQEYINIIAPKLLDATNIEHAQEKDANGGSKDISMADEILEEKDENNEDESDDQEDEYLEKGKITQRIQEECKTYGKEYDKDHKCKKEVARKPQEAPKNSKSKTLGKRKRDQNKTNSPIKQQLSKKKRVSKQAQKANDNTLIQRKDNKQPLTEQKAYVRVNEALKIVISSKELQEFKEQNLDNENLLSANQKQKEIIQGSMQPKTKRQQALGAVKEQNSKLSLPKTQRKMIDEAYFEGYSSPKIHTEMLDDAIRVEPYITAINKVCKGKIILDLGCGSGVLSVAAIKAGATQVYAVDGANIENAVMSDEFKQLIKEEKIKFFHNTIENLAQEDYPQIPKVDIVLSEWMGYFLVFEKMINSYMCAIKTFLKPEGIAAPSHATMYLDVASYNFDENELAKKHFEGNEYRKIVWLEHCKSDYLLSNDHTSIKTFDFTDRNLRSPLDGDGFASDFEILVAKADILNAFIGSFDTKLCDEVFLNTMPKYPATHWKQSIFFIAKPIQVEKGDIIEGKLHIKTLEENHQDLLVSLIFKVKGKKGSESVELFTFE